MQRIKHLCMLLILCMATLQPPAVFAKTTPVITGGTANVQVGQRAEITFSIANADDICGGNLNLVYDNKCLQVVSAKAGDVFTTVEPVINTKYASDTVRITWAGISPIKSSGGLVTLVFEVREAAPSGTQTIKAENIKLYDSEANFVAAQATDASLMVKKSSLVIAPFNNMDKVSVSILFDGDSMCQGGNFVLTYDEYALRPVSVSKGAMLSGFSYTHNFNYSYNALKVSWAGAKPASESGELFKIVFDIVDGYIGDVEFDITEAKLYDETNSSIRVTSEKTMFTIEEAYFEEPCIFVNNSLGEAEGTVPINISANSMVCGGSVEISYDNTKVDITDIKFGNALTGKSPAVNKDFGINKIRLSWAGPLPMTEGGTLIDVCYKAKENVSGFVYFNVENCILYDSETQKVEVACVGGGVNILTPGQSATASQIIYGDEGSVLKTDIYNCPADANLVVVLYFDGYVSSVMSKRISDVSQAELPLPDCWFDTAKVMIWNSDLSLKPMSHAEVLYNQ